METRFDLIAAALDMVLEELPQENYQAVIKAALKFSEEERINSLDVFEIAGEIWLTAWRFGGFRVRLREKDFVRE